MADLFANDKVLFAESKDMLQRIMDECLLSRDEIEMSTKAM